ncbi:cryptochrome/photolyase family protein [[Limnothrix rosea] IAM M-220]|uniref:cryptochrome/photolyase family protein n=1 Tax=[Limnothrix rosea] IAM M-220 TaxID=454133 RepID=UPI00095EB031|nr:cryptochrome/photolyase family protein [[Limnothrix rosea] IAM M-220]OKH12496.1 cryptochrome/photolyase family protein [[Limnothrix rosea] IAM M-220]
MATGIWVLGDQLWQGQAALLQRQKQQNKTPVILIESADYARQRPYHYQKLVLVWSAMRHFAEELRDAGWSVEYAIAEDFLSPLQDWIKKNEITELLIMEPGDRPFADLIKNLDLDCQITFVPNNHFLWSREEFQDWAKGRKRLVLEDFYREGRKRFNILMDGKKPVGGKWNFDKDNRRPPKKNINPPKPQWFEPDDITQAVIERVKSLDLNGYGKIEPFQWAVTQSQAKDIFQHFLATGLEKFGTFQDAMVEGEETLWHSLISPYLNIGLLQPLDLIQTVAAAYTTGGIPLNNIEGFIRQVLGWREYLYGIYHHVETDYPKNNYFDHQIPLPDFFWDSSKTDLNCLKQTLAQTERTGYAHHIQRLMVLSNFGLIVGINPQALEAWFHAAFIDAYDWVMQTNVIGMGQFADGGILATKPYAASANYINKMSNYCSSCRYNKGDRHGENACPFNTFYWDFLDRHQEKLRSQGRMNLILKNLERIDAPELSKIRQQAVQWRERLRPEPS